MHSKMVHIMTTMSTMLLRLLRRGKNDNLKDVINKASMSLKGQGWSISDGKDRNIAFLARKENIVLSVVCSANDRKLNRDKLFDARYVAYTRRHWPVFIYSGDLDVRIRGLIFPGRDILLNINNISEIDNNLSEIIPVLRGAVDHIEIPNKLKGWARLSPHGQAALIVYDGDSAVGEGNANIFRSDLTALGEGNFGFDITLQNSYPEVEYIISRLEVVAYYNNTRVGLVPFWDNAIVTKKVI